MVGFGAAALSLMVDPWIMAVRTELNVVGSLTGVVEPTPTPVLGWFSYVDGVCIAIGVAFLLYQRTVVRAIRSIHRMPSVRRNWCTNCTYELERAVQCGDKEMSFRRSVCPECGHRLLI